MPCRLSYLSSREADHANVQSPKLAQFGTRRSNNLDVLPPPVQRDCRTTRQFHPKVVKNSAATRAITCSRCALRPTKAKLAKVGRRAFLTPAIKTPKLKLRVKAEQQPRRIKRRKLILQSVCKRLDNNNRLASRATFPRRLLDNRLLPTLVCRMLLRHKIPV